MDAGSIRLEGGAGATFDAGFFYEEAQVTLASSTAPQPAPENADAAYARSVSAAGPSVTLTLPYNAIDLSSTFAERKGLCIDVPKRAESESEMLEVLITLADGTEHFYLESSSDAERPDEGGSEGPQSDVYSVTLDNLQLRGGAAEGAVTVRVRAISADENARLITQTVPSGFVLEDVVTGLNQGVVFDFAPDGRIFIGEKGGAVRVFEDGTLESAPFIDLSSQVNSRHDRGMLGLAVHPDFPAQPYVYLLFTYDPPELSDSEVGGPDGNGARVSRLVRVTADEAKGYNVAVPGSEKVLLGTNSTFANIGDPEQRNGPPSCEEGNVPEVVYVRDCLPADEQSHTIGTVRFGPDGSLFIGNGDGANYTKSEPYTRRALSLDSLAGKIMRIDPVTGEGYADNPFFDGDPNSNRSKVYSSGLRNPFRFTVHPTTGEPFVGDVGRGTWEEVNTGEGANFGWPCYEGGGGENLQQGGFRSFDFCQDFYDGEATPPLYSYTRSGTSASIQVGDFYTGTRYPDEYRGALFITDYNQRWIRTLTFNADGSVADVNDFGTEQGVVQMVAGPGGDLYLMNIAQGKLKRLRYTAAGNTPPEAKASATGASGSVPLTVSFTGDESTDDDGDTLLYAWDFGDGATSSEANPVHTYEEMSLYRARLTVTDAAGASNTDTVLIEAGTTQPVARILSPEDGATFTVGDPVPFLASDQGETLTDAEDFSWSLKLNHNEHQHFDQLPPTMGVDGAFSVPDHGDNTSLELCLQVMRGGNKSDPSCVTLMLNTVEYTLETEPSGLSLSWEGVERTTPFTVETNVNARQQLSALAEQEGLDFVRWSDGGARIHDITVGDTPQTLTATYESSEPPTPACGGLAQEAEAGELFGAFRVVESASASGGHYIDTPDGFGHQEDSVNPEHRVDYCVNVSQPGRYKLTGWVQGAKKSDSFYVGVDGDIKDERWDTPRNNSFEPQDAGRRNKPPFTFDLEAGEHTVSIYMREDGTRLDKLELVRVDTGDTSSDTCGTLAQEAEDGTLFGAFRAVESALASNEHYIDTPEKSGNQRRANAAHRADYCMNITEAGRYKLRGWTQGAKKSDSFFVAVGGSDAERWDVPRGNSFSPYDAARKKRSPHLFDLVAGEHTVSIYLRKDGTRLDKLELVRVD